MAVTQLRLPRQARIENRLLRRLWKDRWIYVFILPFLVFYLLYTVYPILTSYWYSLLDWTGFTKDWTYVGLQNYLSLVQDKLWWNAFKNTFLFMVITVPIRVSLALLIAIVLNNPRLPLARFFRTALFLPVVTTMAIIGVVMIFVFDPANGPINLALRQLGLIEKPLNLLGSSGTALYTSMGIHIWKWFGITLVYWLAALQTIPTEMLEAAQVDGANNWQILRFVTLPMLVPFLIIITLITALDTLRVFDLILTLTGGGPFFASDVVEVYIYRSAFAATIPQLGYASAAAVFFGLATLAIALLQGVGIRFAQQMRADR